MRAVSASLLALAMLVAPTSRATAQDAVDVELEPEPDSDLVGPVVLIGVGLVAFCVAMWVQLSKAARLKQTAVA